MVELFGSGFGLELGSVAASGSGSGFGEDVADLTAFTGKFVPAHGAAFFTDQGVFSATASTFWKRCH